MDHIKNLRVGKLQEDPVYPPIRPIWKDDCWRSPLEEVIKPFLQV